MFIKIPTAKRPPTLAASVVSVAQTTSAGQPTKSDSADTPCINILIHAIGHVFAHVDQMEWTFATRLDCIETLLQSVNNSLVLNNPPDLSGIWNMYRNPNMVGSHQGTGMTQHPPTLLQDCRLRIWLWGHHTQQPLAWSVIQCPHGRPHGTSWGYAGNMVGYVQNTLGNPQHPTGKNSLPYIFVSVLMICIR